MGQKKERESGLELLRILLMLQVIFLHICCYGTYTEFGTKAGGVHSLLYWFVMMLSRTPVYMYIVIMGYFMINKDLTLKDSFQKIKSIYLVIIFYSVGIWAILAIAGQLPFSWADRFANVYKPANIVRAFLPITTRSWSFLTSYILVLFFAPFINRGLKDIPKRTYQILVGVLFFVFSLWILFSIMEPTKGIISTHKVVNNEGGKSLYGMLFMYILGGYVRRFAPHYEKAKFRYLVMAFALAALNMLLVYKLPGYKSDAMRNDNPISIILGIMLLMFFKDLKFKSKVVNTIAKHNIGVYIIHENQYVRSIIWNNIITMNIATFYATNWYPLKLLGIGIGVFVVCALLDAVREQLFRLIAYCWNKRHSKFTATNI